MATISENDQPHGILHGLFDLVVILKGLNGLAEIASGSVLFLLQTGTIMAWVNWLTQVELIEDPHDFLAISLHRWALGFGHDAQVFAGLYLLAHGVVKIVIASLLFMEKTWAFPLAITLFSILVAFSIYRLSQSASWPLTGFIAFDLVTIGLIAKEWRVVLGLGRA